MIEIEAIDTNCASCTGCDFIPSCNHKLKYNKGYEVEKTFYTTNNGTVTCGFGYIFKVKVVPNA